MPSPSKNIRIWPIITTVISEEECPSPQQVLKPRTNDIRLQLSFSLQDHDCSPCLFSYTNPDNLQLIGKVDSQKQSSKGNLTAMQHFCNLDKKAIKENKDSGLDTLHQYSIR
ncbi:unnamed protein product [Eretmochelys imbricata]